MFSELYLLFGVLLLVSGLAFALKVGLWVWVATRFFGRPAPPPEAAAPESGLSKVKSWLAIISTVVGLISTSVGLLEKCNPDKSQQQTVAPYSTPTPVIPVPSTTASYCCTPQGRCAMMMPATTGSVCTCVGMLGVFQGTACN